MERPQIGYIGVGLMGLPMVQRLVSLGYPVVACDIAPDRLGAAARAGARPASSPHAAVHGAEFVLLNLPTTAAVEQAVFGERGLADALRPPQLLVDFSTIEVESCKSFAVRLRDTTGCGWVDAPVSGGPPASAAGSLTVMAGGAAEDIERLQSLMADVASRFTRAGPSGSGLAVKMINQLIVGCGHAVMAEALLLAEAAGLDASRIPECLAGGYADSALLQRLYPRMLRRDFAPQGYARQLLKDMEMVNGLAAELKAPVPMTAAALSLYRMLIHLGYAELDSAGLFKLYERN